MHNHLALQVTPNTPCKIGILGPKEVGKTTLANLLTGYLKSIGASSDLVHESARKSPLKLNERTSFGSAYWLVGSQIAAEALVQGTRQFVVCDRTVLDFYPFLSYSVQLQRKEKEVSNQELLLFKELIRSYTRARPYDLLVYVPIRPELWNIFGEPSDVAFQGEIDRELRTFLGELQVEFHELKALYMAERLQEVMNLLRSKYYFSVETLLSKVE